MKIILDIDEVALVRGYEDTRAAKTTAIRHTLADLNKQIGQGQTNGGDLVNGAKITCGKWSVELE